LSEVAEIAPGQFAFGRGIGAGAREQLPRVMRLNEETEAPMHSHSFHRTAGAIAVLALACGAALSLTGCVDHAPHSRETPPATAGTTRGAEGILQIVHTPRIVVDDEWISPNGCHAIYVYSFAGQVRPDNRCTPGAADPAVTQSNIATTICLPGYAASLTPPAAVLAPYFLRALKDYGMSLAPTIQFDYLIPISLGGASATSNLWPEPNAAAATNSSNAKDLVESELNAAVCAGTITLAAAVQAIDTDWEDAESNLSLPITTGSNHG
jgi:hypothetical protein